MTTKNVPQERLVRYVYLAAAMFIMLRLIYTFGAFPNPDEAYYWLWGRRPELSYYDHPPLHAWLQGISGALFGNTLFALRLPTLLSTMGLLVVFYLYLQRLVGERARIALLLTFTLMCASPVMFAFLATAWPDHLMLVASVLSIYLFLRFFDTYLQDGRGDTRRLLLAAATLGLTAMSKYTAVFIVTGLFFTLLFNPRLRSLLLDPRIALAALVTLLVKAPVLIWNLENGMASFRYHLMQRTVIGTDATLSIQDGLGFLFIIIITLSPFVVWLLYKAVRSPRHLADGLAEHQHYLQLPLWVFTTSTATFVLLSLYNPMLYYWNVIAYPLLFPVLAALLLVSGNHRLAMGGHIIYGLLFALLMIFHTTVIPASAYVDEQGDQDSRMLFGWDRLGPRVQHHLSEMGTDTLLMATDYRTASALAFVTGRADTICISTRRDQFDYWQQGKEYAQKRALILYDDWHPLNRELRRLYRSIETVETVEVVRLGRFLKRYYLAVGSNPSVSATHR